MTISLDILFYGLELQDSGLCDTLSCVVNSVASNELPGCPTVGRDGGVHIDDATIG